MLVAMERKALFSSVVGAALAVSVVVVGPVVAQETGRQPSARTTTQSLNTGPADSSLGSRPPSPPLPQVRRIAPPAPVSPAAPRDPVAELLGRIETASPPAPAVPAAGPASGTDTRTAAVPTGPASALPPLPIGYYVRGDKACNQIWPLAGDLAWLSELTFTIDFGGCEPGEITQVSDTTWRERQTCQTELGGEGPPYIVDYEAAPDGVLVTRARLGETALGMEDRWKACAAGDVPAEARFHADDPGRVVPDLEIDPDQDA
ncbi:hypothetical protein [Brevundimonas variabilis]|uniref:Uncharacterized protein n=1 Tax=Brevundimonas variabilis TaxID=74312 RepID=A0A7W9FEQ1_9CAUL|nr:hypothetical protein [Brevundimonas variabilis]MBB5744584.1 hypothetical protein [Brevundimonas variabilis]